MPRAAVASGFTRTVWLFIRQRWFQLSLPRREMPERGEAGDMGRAVCPACNAAMCAPRSPTCDDGTSAFRSEAAEDLMTTLANQYMVWIGASEQREGPGRADESNR